MESPDFMEKLLKINKKPLPLNTFVERILRGIQTDGNFTFFKFSFKSRGWGKSAENNDDGQITLWKFYLFREMKCVENTDF